MKWNIGPKWDNNKDTRATSADAVLVSWLTLHTIDTIMYYTFVYSEVYPGFPQTSKIEARNIVNYCCKTLHL